MFALFCIALYLSIELGFIIVNDYIKDLKKNHYKNILIINLEETWV